MAYTCCTTCGNIIGGLRLIAERKKEEITRKYGVTDDMLSRNIVPEGYVDELSEMYRTVYIDQCCRLIGMTTIDRARIVK